LAPQDTYSGGIVFGIFPIFAVKYLAIFSVILLCIVKQSSPELTKVEYKSADFAGQTLEEVGGSYFVLSDGGEETTTQQTR
jgi:hypothetical protein